MDVGVLAHRANTLSGRCGSAELVASWCATTSGAWWVLALHALIRRLVGTALHGDGAGQRSGRPFLARNTLWLLAVDAHPLVCVHVLLHYHAEFGERFQELTHCACVRILLHMTVFLRGTLQTYCHVDRIILEVQV